MTFFPDSKTFIQIGSFTIAWYAICIIIGAVIAYKIGQYNFKRMGLDKEVLSDYFFGLMITGVIGARIWYVIFMWNELYANNPIEIIMFRHGGLAIQGGIFVGLVFSWWYFRKHKIDFMVAGDAIMPGVLVAQALGRWGNFFNQEAFGGPVGLKFLQSLHLPDFIIEGMYINGQYYHPTFLYESLANIAGFLIIYFVIRKIQTKQGEQFFSYFIWYGIFRFFIEGLRTDSLYIMGLRTAQLVSVVFVVVGIAGYIYCKKCGKPAIKI
ncbi:prolipoprotein diacylglyceryl transferase [Thomasclavelia cocleata]|uniref:prolipoprotein diacylglyceryl transferase n=1 Tax=Thomasclavelia cocleata TaxID=69824 RepID=UPI002432E083|nr:prolipoprotein diacylglyceryl transferase [Thomasclavelia cocleata]